VEVIDMIVLINPSAGGGRALSKWSRVEPHLRENTGHMQIFVTDNVDQMRDCVNGALSRGHREFVAGGGDGTVNAVLASLVECAPAGELSRISLGAIGLGSSNDFHKPYRQVIEGVPCRIGFASAAPHDIGVLSFVDPQGWTGTRYWLINASIGTTAEANHFFNHPDRVLRFLKRKSTSSGILYAAANALLRHRAREMTITLDDSISTTSFTRNIGVVKNPHFAGSLHYDTPYEPDSGEFYVHSLDRVSLPRLALTFAGLARGRFTGRKGTRSWKAHKVAVRNCGPFAVEFDGEVAEVSEATFSLIRGQLKVCS
jgi:diacylglycerol kinase family enzyme